MKKMERKKNPIKHKRIITKKSKIVKNSKISYTAGAGPGQYPCFLILDVETQVTSEKSREALQQFITTDPENVLLFSSTLVLDLSRLVKSVCLMYRAPIGATVTVIVQPYFFYGFQISDRFILHSTSINSLTILVDLSKYIKVYFIFLVKSRLETGLKKMLFHCKP